MADYNIHLSLREVSDIEDLGIVDKPSGNGVVSVINEVIYSTFASGGFTDHGAWAEPSR
jgi:hypothetical protein